MLKQFLPKTHWIVGLVLMFVIEQGNPECSFGQQSPVADGTAVLLSRLDLTKPELEKVNAASGNPEAAAKELLAYYRARTTVKHPIDRTRKNTSLGRYATAREITTADNALRHIFVGQPAYPPHFCGEDINWNSRPVPDNEWVWQLNRMTFWTAMSRAYWHTGDEKYAEAWVFQLTDWVKKNPRDNNHAHAWRSLEAGLRSQQWTYLFQHFLDSPAFTPEFLVTFLNSCHEHASYLMTRYSTGSNWALKEADGMAFIAIIFPEFKDAEKWRTEAITRLNKEINNQVNSDGHQRELAIGYHLGALSLFTSTLDLAHLNGMGDAFPDSYRATIEKMCEVPMKLGMPDGSYTQFGNSWKGNPGASWNNLRRWAARYNRPDFLYVATEGREGERPQETAFAYRESGLYSMRSGWDRNAICLVLKCGPAGSWHTHPDNGTFELYAGGRHLMPDSGSFVYSGDPENTRWFRQTRVHQTLTLDGKDTAFAPKLLLWQPGDDLDLLVVENASYPDLTHRRAVFFVDKEYFVIVDEAYGTGKGDVAIHFHLAPGEAVLDNATRTARTDFKEGWNILVRNVMPEEANLEEEEGQVSFVYTIKEPRPAFSFRVAKTDETGIRYVTIVVPYAEHPPVIQAELLEDPVIGGNKLDLRVTANGKSRRIGYGF
jgi:heparan-sulfate lyase